MIRPRIRSSFTTQASRIDGATVTLVGGNIGLSATDIQSSGKTQIAAAGNLILDANTDSQSSYTLDISHSSSFFNSKTTTDEHSQQSQTARGTTISGDSVAIQSGADIGLKGSSVVGTHDVSLAATGSVTIESAEESNQNRTLHQEKTSGLFGNGGLSVTLGSRSRTDTATGQDTTQLGSTVGSVQGNVDIQAGEAYTQTGSQILAPGGNIAITGKQITIQEARETQFFNHETKAEQSGLTLSVTSPVLSAIQTAQQMQKAASQTSDSRMKALAVATSALAGLNAYYGVQAGQGATIDGKDSQIATFDAQGKPISRDANAADQVGGLNVSISLGSSKSQSSTTQTGNTAAGSAVISGGNTTLTATGAGKDSNLIIQGSTVKAGNNLALTADNQINLRAAQNTSELHGSNSSSSASIGVGFALGGSQNGFTIQAGASQGRGKSEGSDLAWTNTEVQAGNTLTLQSGGDTTLKGAVASGKQVTADIGGNLNIESLQDTSKYDSKQQSAGVSISLCIPPFCYGASTGSLSLGQSKANGDYASVQEQSGIKAGDGGFQVTVKGNTDLKGAVIASTDKAVQDDKNSLTTASLTTSDIQNKAEASADSSGINLSTDMLTQGKYGLAMGVIGNALNSGEASGTSSGQSLSAVSGGTVVVTDESAQLALTGKTAEQTVAGLNRDTVNAQTAAQRQDVQGMERTAQAEQAIKQEAVRQTTVVSDAVYRADNGQQKIVLKKCEAGGACTQNEVNLNDHTLVYGPDGRLYVFNNGIFNTQQQALENATQQQPNQAQTGIYTVINPYTGNAVAEVFYAGLDELREITGQFGMSNASAANIDLRNLVQQHNREAAINGGQLLQIFEVDHSRGSLTSSIATQAQIDMGQSDVPLGTVIFYGAAANAERMADRVESATSGAGQVLQSTHVNDAVGTLIGGNAPTGGQQSGFEDAHGSYTGGVPPALNAEGEHNRLRQRTDGAWGPSQIGTPVLVLPRNKAEGE